jgi:pimeloyl-ACP methyl ester carboxylesterase
MSIMQAGLAIVIAYILVATIIYFVQDGLLFHPTHARHADVRHHGVQHYQFDSGSGILRGWLVNPQFIDHKLVIYYGGNAEDVYFAITDYQHLNAATLFMAYRGYGASDGKPGEKELKADALAIFDDIVERYNPRQIYLVGRSLGSGLACHTAARRTVAGTILITPYDSLVHVAKKHYPWLPVGLLMKHRFNSLADLPQISSPILVIYGGRDRVIPPPFSENLITNIRASKKVVYIEQAGHNTISSFPEYWPSIRLFIDQHGR